MLFLAIFVYLELVVRSALILISAAFLPVVVILGIWPRLSGAFLHLIEFMAALLLSKFFIASAIYIGYSLVAGQDTGPNSLMSGLAVLFMAAFAPVALFRGLHFTNRGGALVARDVSSRGAQLGALAGGAAVAGLRLATGRVRPRLASLWRRRTRPGGSGGASSTT
jgi:hypothetical protein